MKNNRKSKLKNRKGSVSLLVAITIFTFIVILMGGYLTIMILRQSQYESNIRIQEIYGKDVDRAEEIYEEVYETMNSWNKQKQVNNPKLLTGMTPIKFEYPTEDAMGETVTTNEKDDNWYEYGTTYETKRWANAQTEDGSMWVWIPRFAYKINSEEQTTDVVFLIGTTDYYYDENGEMQLAQRCKAEDEYVETDSAKTEKYTVHPAFTDESSINFRNGGWDDELTGIWVAKFEAGYASGNNNAEVVASNVNYTGTTSFVPNKESGETNSNGGTTLVARNWLDGIYAIENEDGTYSWKDGVQTSIKYPVFMPLTYSMNYITTNDCYNITKAMTASGNIYGFSNLNADSHLMKNSEWGAVTYLSKSKYGLYNEDITINNANIYSGLSSMTKEDGNDVASVYGITGCTSNSTSETVKITEISLINAITKDSPNNDGIYVWNQKTGQNASTTGTIYGIFDLSGGNWEKTASFISNGYINLLTNAKSLLNEADVEYDETVKDGTGKSTKYVTVYPSDDSEITDLEKASNRNYEVNSLIYGDTVRETSTSGVGSVSWYSDYSYIPAYTYQFYTRGGHNGDGSKAGLSCFNRDDGSNHCYMGFRAVLCAL